MFTFYRHLREDIVAIRERDPAARSTLEVLVCYPGLHAVLWHRLAHALWTRRFYLLGRCLSQAIRFLTGIEIHPGAQLGRRIFIDHGMGVIIGETAQIGDDCTIYQGVTLGGTSLVRGSKRHPTLESGVIVGAGAKILGSFTVGKNSKIGSNAVVTKPVPAHAVVIGNPARIITMSSKEAQPKQAAFLAYGLAPDADDPVSLAIHGLIEHSAKQSEKIEAMVVLLEKLGSHLAEGEGCKAKLDVNVLRQLDEMIKK